MLGKLKQSFGIGSITIKHIVFRRGKRKIHQELFHDHYRLDGRLGIDN